MFDSCEGLEPVRADGGRPRPYARVLVGTLAALALSVTAACSGSTSEETTTEVTKTATNQTLTVGVATMAEQYGDPVLANAGNLFAIKWDVGEPLVRYSIEGKPVAALAEKWSLSDDKLTWTFNLRTGVQMQDGSTFTAEDVKTSIDRVMTGAPEFASYASFAAKFDSVKVINDATVSITTKTPFASLLPDMPVPIATAYFEKLGEDAFRKAPIAAGPFKFVSQKQNDSMTLQRFDDFWDKSRLPNFKNLIIKIMPDDSSRIAGLQTGQIDVATGLTPSAASQLENASGVKLLRSPEAASALIFLPETGKAGSGDSDPVDDVRVRKALLMAIDRKAIAESLYRGFATVPNNITLSNAIGGDKDLGAVPYDVAGAKKLLKDAGQQGFQITLNSLQSTTGTIPDVVKFAESVVGYWKQAGIDAKLNLVDPAEYIPAMQASEYKGGVVMGAPGLLVQDPAQWQLFLSSTGPFPNTSNAELDAIFGELGAAVTPEEREAAGAKLTKNLYENQWGLPIVNVDSVTAIGSKVAEFKQQRANPYAGPFWYLNAK